MLTKHTVSSVDKVLIFTLITSGFFILWDEQIKLKRTQKFGLKSKTELFLTAVKQPTSAKATTDPEV